MKQLSPLAIALFVVATATAADWPTYRADAQRSGHTSEQLPRELSLAWTYRPLHGPNPAWPRDDRMMFDRAFDVTVSGSLAFFGHDDTSRRAVDHDGVVRWEYRLGTPLKTPPAVSGNLLFVHDYAGNLWAFAPRAAAL